MSTLTKWCRENHLSLNIDKTKWLVVKSWWWISGNRAENTHPSPSTRHLPEGCVLSFLDPPATQAIPAIRVRVSGISVQGLALRAVPVTSRLHQSHGGSPCPPESTGCAHSQLPRRLAHTVQSCRQLCAHKDLGFKNLSLLGLRVNWGKSKLVPTQRISFLGMELDSVNQTARLTQERAQSVLNCLKTLSGRKAVPLKLFQRYLGHMAAAAATVPLVCSI